MLRNWKQADIWTYAANFSNKALKKTLNRKLDVDIVELYSSTVVAKKFSDCPGIHYFRRVATKQRLAKVTLQAFPNKSKKTLHIATVQKR